jgi:hypothetical protein
MEDKEIKKVRKQGREVLRLGKSIKKEVNPLTRDNLVKKFEIELAELIEIVKEIKK